MIIAVSTSLHGQRRAAGGDGVARQPVGRHQDAAEIVGRMPPFRGEPRVVEIEPADHRADVERGLHRDRAGSGVPGTLAPFGTTVPGTIGPSSFVHAGYDSASKPQPSVSSRQ